jgi:glycosyltransferase involved in cell wall biosynthesis
MLAASPTVSIVMPVRNGGAFLPEAVNSILDQTVAEFEFIIVDDGSTDGALSELSSDSRIRVVPAAGVGIVDALNTGLGQAQGRYVARMDADDIARPGRLATQIAYLDAHPEVGVCGGRVRMRSPTGTVGQGYREYEKWINGLTTPQAIARELYVESPIPHPTAMIRREALDRLQGYRKMPWAEDYDLWLRANALGIAMGKPDAVVLDWRDHAGRLSRRDPRCSPSGFMAAKAHFLADGPLADRHAVIWGAATTGASLHDCLTREGVSVTGFVDIDPKKIGGRKRGLPVWGPRMVEQADGALILGAVGARGARPRIREALLGKRLIEGRDFLFVA